MTRPRWLADKAALTSRQAHADTCHGCGADILAGLNADHCAWPVTVDAHPADLLTAVAAYLAGTAVHCVLYGELHQLCAMQLTSSHRNGLPLHLLHTCPTPTEETLL